LQTKLYNYSSKAWDTARQTQQLSKLTRVVHGSEGPAVRVTILPDFGLSGQVSTSDFLVFYLLFLSTIIDITLHYITSFQFMEKGRAAGRVRLFVGNRGSGRVTISRVSRVGSKKCDPWTTLKLTNFIPVLFCFQPHTVWVSGAWSGADP